MQRFISNVLAITVLGVVLAGCAQGPAPVARTPFPHQQPYAGSFFPQQDIALRASDGRVEIYDVYGDYQPAFVPVDHNARQVDFGVLSAAPVVPLEPVAVRAMPRGPDSDMGRVNRRPPPKHYNN